MDNNFFVLLAPQINTVLYYKLLIYYVIQTNITEIKR
jgi:hypothetical protein